MGGDSYRKGLLIIVFLLASFLLVSNFAASYMSVDFPVAEDNYLGRYIAERHFNLDFNMTFDRAFPLEDGKANITVEILRNGQVEEGYSSTRPIRPFLEKHGVVRNNRYVYRPYYFNFSVSVLGRNITREPVTFNYSVRQVSVEPDPGEGDKQWRIWGTYISGVTDNYCSGPWDFNENLQAYMCGPGGVNGVGVYCCDDGDCIAVADSDCASYPDGSCTLGGPSCPGGGNGGGGVYCCDQGVCTEVEEPDCSSYDEECSLEHPSCPWSFLPGTEISLPSGTKNIEEIETGDYVLSFENGEVVERKVSFVLPPHPTNHYYVLRTANREVEVTENHEFFTPGGFRKVSEISEGEEVNVLEAGKLVKEEIIFKGIVLGEVEVYDFGVEGTRTYFANGFAVHNQAPVTIQIRAPTLEGGTSPYQATGPILRFEQGDSEDVPNEPPLAGAAIAPGDWAQSHSWKLETFVYSKQSGSARLNIYPDDGAMLRIKEYPGGTWENKSCSLGTHSIPCRMDYIFDENKWYQIQVYLFNNPGGVGETEEDNPTGVRIEDYWSKGISILNFFGGEDVATMSSLPPGTERYINRTYTMYSNEFTEVRELGALAVYYEEPIEIDTSEGVELSVRGDCEWRPRKTLSLDMIGTDRLRREADIGEPYDVDSLLTERDKYRIDGKKIGGVYKCKERGAWGQWTYACPNSDHRYEYQTKVCCYVEESTGGVRNLNFSFADEGIIILEDYDSEYSYVINYLNRQGYYKNRGGGEYVAKLCAFKSTVAQQTKITPEIREIADSITGDSETEIVKNILQWEEDNLEFDAEIADKWERTADEIISSNKYTGCKEYSFVFIALARAKDIPTVHVEGINRNWLETADIESDTISGHGFADVYIDGEWLPVDPANGDFTTVSDGNYTRLGCVNDCEYVVLDKGLDSWDIGIRKVSDLRRKIIEKCNKEDIGTCGYAGEIPPSEASGILHRSDYTNEVCNNITGDGCCSCRPGYGCTLDCINEEDVAGSDLFTLPFPLSGLTPPNKWDVVIEGIEIWNNHYPVINVTAVGDERNGWNFFAEFDEDAAERILYRNFTIPLNLYSDFNLSVPEYVASQNTYEIRVKVSVEGEQDYVKDGISFDAVQCLNPGQTRSFYDEDLWPGTLDKGPKSKCMEGREVCRNLTLTNYEWVYENTHDKPVYPVNDPDLGEGTGSCDGWDNDCDGIVDDVRSFDYIINQILQALQGETGVLRTPYEITKCGCFMGRDPQPEICNGIDDDCDGTVDNTEKTIRVNTCDDEVWECLESGSTQSWCYMFYNSSTCSIVDRTISETQEVIINTCTEEVDECEKNRHRNIVNDVDGAYYTYDECKGIYMNFSCFMNETEVKVLERVLGENTCRCSGGDSPVTETNCNGIDDDCNDAIDDVEFTGTCGCALMTNVTRIGELKGGNDYSCDGIDSDCDGVIDEDARNCACAGRPPGEVIEIKGEVEEICDGIDNDCDGYADENFQNINHTSPKPCGYGVCSGGYYVCGVHGEEAVCNTTVYPNETFSGSAVKFKGAEICDLSDNDCDYSVDEDCSCTPEGSVKVCGYQSGVYYKSRGQLDQVCTQVVEDLERLISWAEAPENVNYRRAFTVNNTDNVYIGDYPVKFILNTSLLHGQNKIRNDGGDIRITPAGQETHVSWGSSEPFLSGQTTIWFKTDLQPNEEKEYYLYYGNPTATYAPLNITSVVGIDHETGVFLLCHFDGGTTCEGNMVPKHESGISYDVGKYMQGIVIGGGDSLSYPTSENFNKNRGTMVLWFKPSDLGTNRYLFYSRDFDGGSQFALHFNGTGTFFEVWDRDGEKHTVNGGLLDTEWHHLAVTWDNLRGIEIYVDGIKKDSKQTSWEANDIGLDVYIGSDGSGREASSVIDELAIYSRILDATKIREKMRYYVPEVEMGNEETMEETIEREEVNVFEKCNEMLGNVTFTGNAMRDMVLSLCDSFRICQKTDFSINTVSECTFGTQECTGNGWGVCNAVEPGDEVCDGKDNDCNGVIDDIVFPETCGCYNGSETSDEVCNGIDDDCNGVIDDVGGGDSMAATHCGCFNEIVNMTQKINEPEIECNGIDDNCDGIIDENVFKCACSWTVFGADDNVTKFTGSQETVCDDVDNDCNGVIDDPWQQNGSAATQSEYLGAKCGGVYSSCVGGIYVCSRGGTGLVCSTTSDNGIQGQDLRGNETCNGRDDDCDGAIDDVWGDISNRFCQCHEGVPKSEEVCDGKDNNCDGLVDNGISGCGCSFDMGVDVNHMKQLSSLINAKIASDEVCNNVDDNCDGEIDNGLEGECFCSGGFSGNPAARPEFCNGVDDDCDQIIDNVAYPGSCACRNGTHESGELEEVCDGIDNNCNGLVDEDWLNLGGACGFGVCSGGVYECSEDKEEQVCSTGPGGPGDKSADEICGDGIDNDCDGVVDENCVCDEEGEKKGCSKNLGECREGVQTCVKRGSDLEWSGCIGGVLPETEVCDGKDNDCDGTVDDIPGGKCRCYGGEGKSEEVCNGIDDDCNGAIDDVDGEDSVEGTKCGCYGNLYGKGAKIEVCNGIDDDCDGTVDNVKDGNSIPSTKCACYGGGSPSTEKCNGVDDNCNGEMDENWPSLGDSCGKGICTGVFVCSADGRTAECSGALPETEVCDDKDNDCDDRIDEGCWGPEIGSCENGIQDGDEEGVDCGGSCPKPCAPPPRQIMLSGMWVIVFAVLVVIIVVVGLVLFFLK